MQDTVIGMLAGGATSEASGTGGMKVHFTLIFIRGTLNVEQVLRDACTARNNIARAAEDEETAMQNRFCIHHVPPRGGDDGDWNGGSDGLRVNLPVYHTPP